MKKTTEDKPKRKRISKAEKEAMAVDAQLEAMEKQLDENILADARQVAMAFAENTPMVSLRGETLYQDKDYIFFNDEWHHIANGETWEQLKKHNSWIKTKKKYISKEKLATLKIGIPLSI